MAIEATKKVIKQNEVQTIIKKRIEALEKESNKLLYEGLSHQDDWLDELANNKSDYLPVSTTNNESNIIAIKELKALLNQINKIK